ncbi:MAG TPA: hypothetical protein PLP23_20460 [Panacibacter sp.]|nr:hypothetical protein [Panacibacter sp.]
MKNLLAIIFIAFNAACNTQNTPGTEDKKDSAAIITNTATIPTERAVVSKKAIASFYKKVPDDLNDWHFSVDVYETKETFHYLMKMQYKELLAEDTLKIPNFGIEPKIEIHEGKDKYACILGFLDKENKFLEYKQVSVKDDNLKVTVLHRYAVSTYQSK